MARSINKILSQTQMTAEANLAVKEECHASLILYSLLSFLKERKQCFWMLLVCVCILHNKR
jgi:hypothetical protein